MIYNFGQQVPNGGRSAIKCDGITPYQCNRWPWQLTKHPTGKGLLLCAKALSSSKGQRHLVEQFACSDINVRGLSVQPSLC